MGRNSLTSEPWCSTCGQTLIEVEVDLGLNECSPCIHWWDMQADEIDRLGTEWESKYGKEPT